jgi:hypothetical protein
MSELAPDIRLSQSHRLLDPMYVSVSGTTLPSVVRSAIPGWPCSRGVLLRLLPAGLSPRAFSQYLLTYLKVETVRLRKFGARTFDFECDSS